MTEVTRASMDELKDFANAVRAAGGGNPLDALMPAVPEDTSRCLIAKNLNFNCTVYAHPQKTNGEWLMALDNKDTRDKIAAALNLEKFDDKLWLSDAPGYDPDISPANQIDRYEMVDKTGFSVFGGDTTRVVAYGVVLPDRIGLVARDFDDWSSALDFVEVEEYEGYIREGAEYKIVFRKDVTEKELADLKEFLPYVDAAVTETLDLADVITELGIVI